MDAGEPEISVNVNTRGLFISALMSALALVVAISTLPARPKLVCDTTVQVGDGKITIEEFDNFCLAKALESTGQGSCSARTSPPLKHEGGSLGNDALLLDV